MRKNSFFVKIILIFVLFACSTLLSYQRKKNSTGEYIYWAIDRVPVYFTSSRTNAYAGNVPMALNAWLSPDSYLQLIPVSIDSEVFIDPNDSKNSIKFVVSDSDSYYDYFDDSDYDASNIPVTLAYTITTTADYTGRLVDVDMVIGVHMLEGSVGLIHLPEVMVHEMGHFVGLDHICEFGGNLVNGIPDCGPIGNVFEVPIMYPEVLHEDRTSITDDDLAGLLSIYQYPAKRYKGCGFLGSIRTENTSMANGILALLLVLIPLIILYAFRTFAARN